MPEPRPKTLRSAVSNGRYLFHERPGDNKRARRFKDLIEDFTAPLGGYDALDEPRRQLVRRLAAITIALEDAEFQLAKGERINHEEYAKTTGHQRRLLSDLDLLPRPAPDEGEEPAPRDPGPEQENGYDGYLASLSDEELLSVMNQVRRANALLPIASWKEWGSREEFRARYCAKGYEFISAFRPPDPDVEDEDPASDAVLRGHHPDPRELVAATREVLGA